MRQIQPVQHCRWSEPTLFLVPPFWLEAERTPWSCCEEEEPRLIQDTTECLDCPNWRPRLPPERPRRPAP